MRQAVEALLVCRAPVLEGSWSDLEPQAVYGAACRFVMRLVVILFAEGRGLLPVANTRYAGSHGLGGLIRSLEAGGPQGLRGGHDAWSRLLGLFALLHHGSAQPTLTLPALGGTLFRPGRADGEPVQRALHLLESHTPPPDDEVIRHILLLLTRAPRWVFEGGRWQRVSGDVDFAALPSETLGLLHEGLLDHALHRVGDDPVVILRLGDGLALPLARLEAMSDGALVALMERGGGRAEDGGVQHAPLSSVGLQVASPAPQDHPRQAALLRARAWARRAVGLGRRADTGTGKDTAWRRRAADALVVAVNSPANCTWCAGGGGARAPGPSTRRPGSPAPPWAAR